MYSFLDMQLWTKAAANRQRQKFLGRISGILLALALLTLFDGLIALMRQGPDELSFLPGQSMSISGPAALKNPLASDVSAVFTPADAPVGFRLEGFFTGYWFGSGMWRGALTAREDADPGTYGLRISFKGAPVASANKYVLKIYRDAAAMRAASFSLTRRWLDLNPFIIAIVAGLGGVAFGVATYIYGRAYARSLTELGLAQIYTVNAGNGSIWCAAPRHLAPSPGNARMVLDESGNPLGEARCEVWEKGKLRLKMLDEQSPPPGALVCLQPPVLAEQSRVPKSSRQNKGD